MQEVLTHDGAHQARKKHRTPGLKIVDAGLYAVLTNGAVFVVSVAATYLTTYGNRQGGSIGRWFFNRGTVFKRHATKFMDEKQADAAKMIAFSFIDGSVMAPFVKLLEDRREKIAPWIDDWLGTRPADDTPYEAEPKQSWGSVFGGRVAALGAVLPTAVFLGKLGTKDGNVIWNGVKDNPGFSSLNDHLFYQPGQRLGRWVETKPRLARYFGRVNIPVIASVALFETFYTSLCTGMLYASSRFLARHRHGSKTAPEKVDALPAAEPEPEALPTEEEALQALYETRVKSRRQLESYRARYLLHRAKEGVLSL